MTTTTKKPRPGKSVRVAPSEYHYRPPGTDRVYDILEFSQFCIGNKIRWHVRLVGDRDWFDAGNTLAEAKIIADNDADYWKGNPCS